MAEAAALGWLGAVVLMALCIFCVGFGRDEELRALRKLINGGLSADQALAVEEKDRL